MRVACVLIALLVAGAAARSLQDQRAQWESFKATHAKNYTPEEEDKRFTIFCENLKEIDRLNAHDLTATYAVTQFSDLTLNEFVENWTGFRNPGTEAAAALPNAKFNTELKDPPKSWDWRDHGAVNDVKNQASCGSCWAFSTVAGLEGQDQVGGHDLPNLSEQELVDCVKECYGCRGGLMHLALQSLVDNHDGDIDTESSYPYTARDGSCTADQHDVGMKGITGYDLWCNLFSPDKSTCDEGDMLAHSAKMGPLMIALNANPLMHYSHGIVNGRYSGHPNHGVAIVGWGTEDGTDYWIVRNSWGASWGEHGYFRIVRDKGECEMNTYVCAAKF